MENSLQTDQDYSKESREKLEHLQARSDGVLDQIKVTGVKDDRWGPNSGNILQAEPRRLVNGLNVEVSDGQKLKTAAGVQAWTPGQMVGLSTKKGGLA